jgi:hypothetical protein
MVNYSNAKIYKIWSPQGPNIYIGSTTKEYLSQRMDTHRSNYRQGIVGNKRYTTSFEIFQEYGVQNCFIELIEAKSCKSKDEIIQLEGHYIRILDCVNKVIPGQTKKEWRENRKQENKESIERIKKWDEENSEERERLRMLDAAPRLKAEEEFKLKYPTVLPPEYIKERQEKKDKIKQQRKERYLKIKQSKQELNGFKE